jgi:hypothetical protein
MGSKVMKMLLGKGVSQRHIKKTVDHKMTVSEAVQRVQGKLPAEVEALVHMTGKTKEASRGDFDESSLEKARKILNGMVEGSQKELDKVILECKEYEERNRGTFAQVTTDLARLGSQISDLSRQRVDANEAINAQDATRLSVEGELQKAELDFTTTRLANEAELQIRSNDLAVFNFILEMVRCKESEFLQLDSPTTDMQVCSVDDGLEIHFNDPMTQAKFERMMTPTARTTLREALGEVRVGGVGLLQQHQHRRFRREDPAEEDPAAMPMNTTTSAMPTVTVEQLPVVEEPNSEGQWKKCTDGKPNCGLLHDTMSIQWGKFKDMVDELTFEMHKNADAFAELKDNLNDQLTILADAKTKSMELLAETISSINADTEEMNEKDTQRHDLEKEYKKKMAECKGTVEEILFTNICAVRKVRNSVMTHSSISPPAKISDCDVGDWVASECTMDCDDSCPQEDPYACGGWQDLTREVVVSPNSFGLMCPALLMKKKCNQMKCPVDCVLSEWSGWSKCTKDCEGGVQGKTRSILTKAKNGGESCDSATEERSCNTGSCDRDCTLTDWTDWSPCTMACGGGLQEHTRSVVVPIRGQGKCPNKDNPDRLVERKCNTQDCIGDELCVASQDLVLAIDGSGSLKESGFDVVRSFAANLTGKYVDMYYGKKAVTLGVVQFGNGQLEEMAGGGSVVAPALNIQGLTSDLGMVQTKILELTWQRGFTNMAQAFKTAGTMITQTGRAEAQSAVLVITDGKYSMAFQTAQQAQKLKDQAVQIYMAVISAGKGEELDLLKKWVSSPWQTNFERIPGLLALEHNKEMFATKIITKFCPMAISPAKQKQDEEELQCIKIKVDGAPDSNCSASTLLRTPSATPALCAEAAREAGALAFMFGKGLETGKCKILTLPMTDDLYDTWQGNRRSPECPSGAWEPNPLWDVYACKAIRDPCGPGSGYARLDLMHSTIAENALADGGKMKLAGIGELEGEPIDLEITTDAGYQVKNPKMNGFSGAFGRINIKTCTAADFTFAFKDASGAYQKMEEFEVTFFDLDRGTKNNKIETLKVSGYDEMITAPAPLYTTQVSGEEVTVAASLKGVGADNPSDPMMLTPEQMARSVAFKFVDKATFKVHYEVECNGGSGKGGRNFMFGFHSSLTPCNFGR